MTIQYKMAGRHKLFEEEEVLEKAMDVFWRKGYEATSTEDLLLAMELNKGSLYNTFKSKKGLFDRVVDHFGDFLIQYLAKNIESFENPIEGIKHVFRNICKDTPEDRQKGCFAGNSISELSNVNLEMERKVVTVLKSMERLFEKYLKKAQVEGYLREGANTKLLAIHLVNLWNGLYVSLRVYDLKQLHEVIEINLSLLD